MKVKTSRMSSQEIPSSNKQNESFQSLVNEDTQGGEEDDEAEEEDQGEAELEAEKKMREKKYDQKKEEKDEEEEDVEGKLFTLQ